MPTPNQAYVSNQVPFGGLFIQIFRLADPGDNTSGVALVSGNALPAAQANKYRLESITPTQNTVGGDRPDIDGGDNGWWLVKGTTSGNGVIQLPLDASPTLDVGDYFDAAIRRDAAGAPVTERFVIMDVGASVATTDYRKQNVGVKVDKFAVIA